MSTEAAGRVGHPDTRPSRWSVRHPKLTITDHQVVMLPPRSVLLTAQRDPGAGDLVDLWAECATPPEGLIPHAVWMIQDGEVIPDGAKWLGTIRLHDNVALHVYCTTGERP